MTIAQTIDDMLAHPYWQQERDRRTYLIDFATCLYEAVTAEAARTYRANRRYTPTECYTAIKNLPPPQLNFWMKRAEPSCQVVQMVVVQAPVVRVRRIVDPMQLRLEFSFEEVIKGDTELQVAL